MKYIAYHAKLVQRYEFISQKYKNDINFLLFLMLGAVLELCISLVVNGLSLTSALHGVLFPVGPQHVKAQKAR